MSATLTETAPRADIFLPTPAKVLEVTPMTASESFFRFELECDNPPAYLPGQFMEVSIPGIGEAPISISSSPSRCPDGTFEMVVRKVGNVTNALHALEAGARVGIRGPFGTDFPVNESFLGKDLVFICGGIGLVPVRSAIDYVLDHRGDYGKLNILFGTRTPADRLFTDDLAAWDAMDGVNFEETVDVGESGWGGNVGVITTLMPRLDIDPANTVAVICGPPIMYKFVLLELRKLNVPQDRTYVSLERHMKCGVGKCGHCQINGLYACQKGPVFKYSDITSIREAI